MATKKTTKKVSKEEEGQPELNLGMVGHVDHGKTTLTQALSGKWTDTHSEEMKRGITIRLGYADISIRKKGKTYTVVNEPGTEFVRKISIVDAPGHESLMATMLSGATIMDGAILMVAANEVCPQPQTREHLMALQICGIEKVIIVQNKIDLVNEERALRNYNQIKEFLKGTAYEKSPIIPISAQHKVNIDVLLETIETLMPTPKRNEKENPLMFTARSFDINKPGIVPEKFQGGILGGSVAKGTIKVGDEIEIRPGRVVQEANQLIAKPIKTKVIGAITGGTQVKEVHAGGSIALQTTLDPSIVKSDSLAGNLVGLPGKLPDIWYDLVLETELLKRVVGSETDLEVEPIKKGEMLMLNVNSAATVGMVTDIAKNKINTKLRLPICADPGARITISRRVGTRFRLIGFGIIQKK